MSIILLLLLAPVLALLILILGLWLMKVVFKIAIFAIPRIAKLVLWLIIALIIVIILI